MWHQSLPLSLGFIASAALSAQACAAFSDTVSLDNENLQLCAKTSVRVLGFINIGDAALYAKDCNQREQAPLQLSIRYARGFTGNELREASDELLRRNLSSAVYENSASEIATINSWYQDIAPGQRYDIHFCEQHGLSLYKDSVMLGQSKAEAPGQDYLSIWLGDKPFSKAMKKALLN